MATARGLPLGLRVAYLAMHRHIDARLAKSGCAADQFVLLGLLARQDGVTRSGPCWYCSRSEASSSG